MGKFNSKKPTPSTPSSTTSPPPKCPPKPAKSRKRPSSTPPSTPHSALNQAPASKKSPVSTKKCTHGVSRLRRFLRRWWWMWLIRRSMMPKRIEMVWALGICRRGVKERWREKNPTTPISSRQQRAPQPPKCIPTSEKPRPHPEWKKQYHSVIKPRQAWLAV